LKEDVGEKMNLKKKYPEKTNELYSKLKNWLAETNATMPQANPDYKKTNQ